MQDGFFDTGDGITKGKGISALNASRAAYSDIIALFGGRENIPSSIMRAHRHIATDESDPLIKNGRRYDDTQATAKGKTDHLPERTRQSFRVSGSGPAAGALSQFPQKIGTSMVRLYTDPGQLVIDPFAGHNSRMELCVRSGRHYIGCDLSTDFMAFNNKRAKELREEFPEVSIKLHYVDSRKMPVVSGIGDFTITSPPYYDIEEYGDEPGQLGKSVSYKSFLGGLQKVMRENLRVLKPGAYAVWFVNDFRRKGVMHFYHVDTMRLAVRAGFIAHDILIVDFNRSMRDCFPNQIVKSRIIPKRHEYGLVFRKPN